MLVPITLTLAALVAPLAPSDPAELLPAETLVYFGTDSVQAGAQASQNTAMSRILGEAEVRAFLSKPTAAANAVLKSILEQAKGEMGDMPAEFEVPDDLEIDLSMGTGDANLGRVFFALTHVRMPMSPDDPPIPDIGLVFGIEFLDAGQLATMKGLWDGIPVPAGSGSHGGVEYASKMIPDSPFEARLAVLGNLAVLSLSEDTLHGVIDRSRSGGDSLAGAGDYKAMVQAAGGASAGSSTYFVRMPGLMQLVQMGLMMGAAESGAPEEMQALSQLFSSIGLSAVRMIGGTSAVGADGMIETTSVASIDTAAPGLVPGIVAKQGSFGRDLLNEIPGDALSASLWTMGDELVTAYDFVMEALGTMEPGAREEIEGMLAGFLGGRSLRDDLLGNLHGDSYTFTVPGTGFPGSPEPVVKTHVRDGDALVAVIRALCGVASEQAGMPVDIKSSEHEGATIYELDLSKTPVGAVMQPAFAIDGDAFVFSTQTRRLKTTLNGASSGKGLSGNSGLASFLDGLGGDVKLQAVGFSNVAENFSTQYGQLAAMLPMVGAMAGNLPLDFSKLPPEQAISQHLRESYSASYVDANGLIINRSLAQFQVADFVPLALIAGLVAIGQAEGIDVSSAVVEEVDPMEVAQLDLRELKAACTVYKISTGGYPESLAALLEPLPDYEEGALPRDALPVDPWGNGYHFAMEVPPGKSKPRPKLWSSGPNGVDENGGGDDVLKF